MRLEQIAIIGGIALVAYMMSPTRKIRRIADAIALAEGYGVPGAIPTVRNNPGNIRDTRTGEIITYASPAEGWAALYRQVTMMLTGESRYYKPTMTIAEVAKTYTGEAAYMNWARNVALHLGVTVDTTLQDV